MAKEREVTRIYNRKPLAYRLIGRPKNRWKYDVRKGLQTVTVRNFKKSILNRDLWKIVVERTKTHIELQRLPRSTISPIYCLPAHSVSS
jgi:hypothetical protein